jgi:hypothetical protein
MIDSKIATGYVAAKRFLRDFPTWFEVVRACATVGARTKGEFAGAWALEEAKRSGVEWFPNLRPLVSYGILRRTAVARRGRRAYYVMEDIAGVRSALAEVEREINDAATEAIGNRMYCFTYGIVGDARGRAEGRGLGTGIGVRWRETYLILTAAHVLQQTPYERLYFFLPCDTLVHPASAIPAKKAAVELRTRFLLEKPHVLLSEDFDLAAVVLELQSDEIGKHHFYELDSTHTTPLTPTQIGFLGYPGATAIPIERNFMAAVYYDFGLIGDAPPKYDQQSQVSVSYPTDNSIDPHGLSGSGLWFSPPAQKKIWAPDVALVGLATIYDRDFQVLVGYKVESLVEFLKSNFQWIRKKSG